MHVLDEVVERSLLVYSIEEDYSFAHLLALPTVGEEFRLALGDYPFSETFKWFRFCWRGSQPVLVGDHVRVRPTRLEGGRSA